MIEYGQLVSFIYPPFCSSQEKLFPLYYHSTVWLFAFHLCVVLTIPFSGSVFTRVSIVERSLSVRVSATIERLLSNCFARMVYYAY